MKIGNNLDKNSEEYKENLSNFNKQKEQWLEISKATETPNPSQPAIQKHIERGKLHVRERIEKLIDSDSRFFEIAQLAGYEVYKGVPAGAGIVTGVGTVEGQDCVIIANDATVKGGTYFPMTCKKHLRAQEIAEENNLPCISLVDSGGAFLPLQDSSFADKDHFGRIFYNQARMSASGIPQIAVVMGMCTAGGAYIPAMCDESVIVKEQGTIFLAGPPLVKAATGEEVTAEELGGADLHCKESGVCDHYAEDDLDALQRTRSIIKTLNLKKYSKPNFLNYTPAFDSKEIYGLIPSDSRKMPDTYEVLARIIDNSDFDEFKSKYAKSIICGFAKFAGQLAGVIANNGILFSESALKATHFIQICNQRKIPIVFLQNIVGFMVGKEYERKGITKDGAKLVTAVACAEVPKITLITGGSYGAGNYAMAGRAYNPSFLFMWPNSRISIMGGSQAADVLVQVKKAALEKRGEKLDKKQEKDMRYDIESEFEGKSSALYSTSQLWDDAIIDPIDTHYVLARAIQICSQKETKETRYGVFRT